MTNLPPLEVSEEFFRTLGIANDVEFDWIVSLGGEELIGRYILSLFELRGVALSESFRTHKDMSNDGYVIPRERDRTDDYMELMVGARMTAFDTENYPQERRDEVRYAFMLLLRFPPEKVMPLHGNDVERAYHFVVNTGGKASWSRVLDYLDSGIDRELSRALWSGEA
jgi:hypothetical protein